MESRTAAQPRHRARTSMSGRHRLCSIDERTGVVSQAQRRWTPNTWAYTYGYLICKLLGHKDTGFSFGAMYFEYQNVASPGDAVTTPSFTRQDDLSYYETLAASPDRDFLRIPLIVSPQLAIAPGYETYLPPGLGNRLTVFAQTAGTTGVFGKPYSDVVNSKVYGIAVVATPVLADRTQDVLFARNYYAADDQIPKTPNSLVGCTYQFTFG